MEPRRILWAATLALLFSTLIVSCAGGPRIRHRHEYTLAPGLEHQSNLSKALLVPINYTNEEPVKGLDVVNDRISALIASHLKAQGIAVERPDAARFRPIADAAYQSTQAKRKAAASSTVSARVEFSDVIPEILETLEQPSDLVVAASVVMRNGQWNGGSTLVWDGVRRRDRTAGAGATTGTSPGASLQVDVYSRDGTRVFSGFGGLDLVFQFNLGKSVMEIRENLLHDERNLAEGVCVAFYPYFGLEGYCAR